DEVVDAGGFHPDRDPGIRTGHGRAVQQRRPRVAVGCDDRDPLRDHVVVPLGHGVRHGRRCPAHGRGRYPMSWRCPGRLRSLAFTRVARCARGYPGSLTLAPMPDLDDQGSQLIEIIGDFVDIAAEVSPEEALEGFDKTVNEVFFRDWPTVRSWGDSLYERMEN